MIKANHQKWAEFIFSFYLKKIMRKNFSNFWLCNEAPVVPDNVGLVITPNHFSWWDGFLIERIRKKFFPKRKMYILMLEEQLKRYWFFNKLGAFSINLKNPRSINETINYTKEIISPDSLVVFYPQGKIEFFDKVPNLKKGLTKFVDNLKLKTVLLPIAFKFQFGEAKHPEIYCRFGEPLESQIVKQDFSSFYFEFMTNLQLLNEASIDKSVKQDIMKD
jgi:1-acyl-sn-glycerol-3-phosphate acyltransferase